MAFPCIKQYPKYRLRTNPPQKASISVCLYRYQIYGPLGAIHFGHCNGRTGLFPAMLSLRWEGQESNPDQQGRDVIDQAQHQLHTSTFFSAWCPFKERSLRISCGSWLVAPCHYQVQPRLLPVPVPTVRCVIQGMRAAHMYLSHTHTHRKIKPFFLLGCPICVT